MERNVKSALGELVLTSAALAFCAAMSFAARHTACTWYARAVLEAAEHWR